MPSERCFHTDSAEETVALGARLGGLLDGGELLLFAGELGTGKTTFIRGLARGLGAADPGAVHSPSYTLVNTYEGPIPFTHIDAYFMQTAEDLLLCGFDEALRGGGVIAIEWADRLESFPGIEDYLPAEPIRIMMNLSASREVDGRKIIIVNWPDKEGFSEE